MIIYKTINLINGKIYVGQDSNNNPDYLGSGLLLEKAFEKYGKENFKKEILEECFSKEELNIREIFWIKELNSNNKDIGYNIAKGGLGGDTISNNLKNREFRKFLSDRNKKLYQDKSNHPMFGKSQSKESNDKRRNSLLGIKRSQITKDKQSKSATGKNNSAFGKKWIHNKELKIQKLVPKDEYKRIIKNAGWISGMLKKG